MVSDTEPQPQLLFDITIWDYKIKTLENKLEMKGTKKEGFEVPGFVHSLYVCMNILGNSG